MNLDFDLPEEEGTGHSSIPGVVQSTLTADPKFRVLSAAIDPANPNGVRVQFETSASCTSMRHKYYAYRKKLVEAGLTSFNSLEIVRNPGENALIFRRVREIPMEIL